MKTLLTILLFLSSGIAACGRQPAINADLRQSVYRYLGAAPNSGHIDELVSVDWGDPQGESLGQCIITPDVKSGYTRTYSRRVKIRWRPDTAAIIVDTLVAHELAHCLHDKRHDDTRTPALMNSVLVEAPEFWRDHLDDEIKALFR